MDEEPPTFSLEDLNALDATRLDILRLLRARGYTASEVADRLRLPRSSAHAHLQALADAGFARRLEHLNQWVYYTLTRKGARLSLVKPPRFVIALDNVGVERERPTRTPGVE